MKDQQLLDEIEAYIASEANALPSPSNDASHHAIAEHFISGFSPLTPVGCEGSLWSFDGQLWQRIDLKQAQVMIARRYDTKLCRRKSDYSGIAQHAYHVVEDSEFFTDAPVGLATPAGFYHVTEAGLECTELTAKTRQRFMVDIEPKAGRMVVFNAYLDATFANSSERVKCQQVALAQEIMGAVLVGIMYRYEKVVLLYGKGQSGKSTLLRILQALIHKVFASAVSPFDWDSDYMIASMAGKRLNLVGELPNNKHIPAEKFKQVTGRDMVSGRFPYGQPFFFTVTAAHLFNSNHFISTRDNTSGFWRRWICLAFDNPVPDDEVEHDLDDRIIRTELPAILHWALEGAARVIRQHGFSESERNHELLRRWRINADSVSSYLNDETAVAAVSGHREMRRAIYEHFTVWCSHNERKAMSNQTFYQRMEDLGYRSKTINGYQMLEGIKLLPTG